MEWYVILALVLGISMILLPVAFVWYLVVGGIYSVARETGNRRRLIRQAAQIVMNREALRGLIHQAIEAAEAKQGIPEQGADEQEGIEVSLPEWAMPARTPRIAKADLVIVGGSAAGIQAAITARRLHDVGKITIIRKEHKVLVPCGIPYIFGTLGSAEKNLIPDALLGDAELIVDEVTSIDRKSQTVATAGSKTIGYDKLILATGSQPLVPPIPGKDLGNVFTVRKDIEYLQGLDQELSRAKDVVIIGGGFIGVEFADECRRRGLNVTIVELLPHCLFLNCDEEFCIRMEEELRNGNVRVMCQNGVKSLLGNGHVTEVELASGDRLSTDLVIMAIGIVPNTKLAQEAGLDIGVTKGIRVDRYMRTTDANILAIGDCAEKYSFFTGKPVPLRLASIATHEARMAVSNLFEPRVENRGALGVFSTKVGDVAIGAAGLTEKAAAEAGFDVIIGKADAPDKHPGAMPGAQRLEVKLLFDRKSGSMLGGEACGGVSVGELTNALAILVQSGATPEDIRTSQIGTHPALSGSPIVYQTTNAAEQAIAAGYQLAAERTTR
jgi:NADH oxidase (H2O2-forming)